jgi:hypothetical protein
MRCRVVGHEDVCQIRCGGNDGIRWSYSGIGDVFVLKKYGSRDAC